jgi:hypothetical protein
MVGYTTDAGDPDYSRIDNYIKGVGKNNPNKKTLYWLSSKEMNAVCTQVEAWYKRELKGSKR